ncbi:MAG: hypothetical protein K2N41_04515 [Lachnospiraceae bacterium]|nr:hypothetical protein [Lachnospiraceae bacterium]MDE7238957.1 hypothetical protein [Lachnospiraceae bacterium]
MKKKLLAILLCTAMTATVLSGCGGGDDKNKDNTQDDGNTPAADAGDDTDAPADTNPEPAEVTPEELPDAFSHITFDEGAGESYVAVTQTENVGDNDGATYGIEPTDVTFAYADGPVGNALYVDGKFGLDLKLEPTNTDAWTVSYWMNADRLSNFGPTLQIGYDIGKAADAGNNVTWMNVTQTDFPGFKAFPIVWSRNEASDAQDGTDCWPWMWGFKGEDEAITGKKEWVMVTVVCSGEVQNGPVGSTTAGAQYYVNGELVYDSQECFSTNGASMGWEGGYTWDATLAPNIMKPGSSTFESYFGINYWDTIFKGFIDDLYVFDSALSAGQVASLYALGNPNVESVAPEAPAEEEPEEPVARDHSDVETTGTVVGAKDFSTPFWTEFSEIYAVASGESTTINFTNWSSGLNNWNNFVVILQSTPDGHSAEDNADYAEYGVVRADNWGWGGGYDNIATAECDWNWDTFVDDVDGASVELTVTNNGDTADVVAVVTSAAGEVHTQTYTGIAVTGDLYFCLTVDGSFVDVQ